MFPKKKDISTMYIIYKSSAFRVSMQ